MILKITPALRIFLIMTLLTGVVYPLAMTGVAQIFFKGQADGSIVYKNGKAVGSELIGQEFKEAGLFHSRPSAVSYNPMASGASNLSPTSADLAKAIQDRKAQGDSDELLFSSGSGLDPHIGPNAALSQVPRIARERGIDHSMLETLIQKHLEKRTFGFLGEPRVNVLLLNLDLMEGLPLKR